MVTVCSTVSREPGRQQQQERPDQAGQAARPAPGQLEQQQNTASPPPRPPEETNGVSLVNQQELDFNSKVRRSVACSLYK